MSDTVTSPAAGTTALTGAPAAGKPADGPGTQAGGGGQSSTPPAPGGEAGTPGSAPPPPADVELKLPDGFEANDEMLGQFKASAKELGLKSEGAQKLFDLYTGAQAAQAKAQAAAVEQQQKSWVDAARADKEYGGAQFDANTQVARKAIQKFGSPELRAILDETGLGNHPEEIRAWYRVGKAIGEDSIAGASGAQGNGASGPMTDAQLAEAMYPKMHAKKS